VSETIDFERLRELMTRGSYHQWLGLQLLSAGAGEVEFKATWREEWVISPERRFTHGGILATLIDIGADWALYSTTGRGVPTIDLRVDYHAAAAPGDLTVKGKVVRAGSQFSCAEARIFDAAGKLLASGRGTYLTAPPKA
jgi:uncharacterized protein (TIGR00369 family)